MKTINEKLKSFQAASPSGWKEKAEWRKANKDWLRKSQMLAIRILRYLKENRISQKELAERMAVSPQQVSKLLKGQENLTLETICKLEKALNLTIISIRDPEVTQRTIKYQIHRYDTSTNLKSVYTGNAHQEYGSFFGLNATNNISCDLLS